MPQSLLARSAAPLALVAGALVVITRVVIMVTTPADIDSLKVYVLTATHAINGVASIVAFAMLVFALVATYELQARAAGVLGVIGLGAAILGTVFMAGDWWYEAFAVPRLAEVAPEVMNTFARSRLLAGGLTSFVLFGIGWVLYGIASVSRSCLPRRDLLGDRRRWPAVRGAHRLGLPPWGRHPWACLRRARGVVAAFRQRTRYFRHTRGDRHRLGGCRNARLRSSPVIGLNDGVRASR